MPFFPVSTSEDLYYVWRKALPAADTGLTFLFVHGLGSSSSFYAPVMPLLAEAGYSCLAFDSSGSCLSPYSRDKSIRDLARDAERLLKGLGIAPATVIAVGHSMGCLVVSHLAIEAGLAGAVLIGSVTPSAAISAVFEKRIQTVEQQGMDAMADTIPTGATGSKATATHHGFIRALLLSQDAKGYIAHCRAIATAELPAYSQARCPALFIAGQEDKTAPLEAITRTMNR